MTLSSGGESVLPGGGAGAVRPILPAMEHYVYRLSDDQVPVVIITETPLPPGPANARSTRILIGVYEDIDDARAVALWARARAAELQDRPPLEGAGAHGQE